MNSDDANFIQELLSFAKQEKNFASAEQVDAGYTDYWEGEENAYSQIVERVEAFLSRYSPKEPEL